MIPIRHRSASPAYLEKQIRFNEIVNFLKKMKQGNLQRLYQECYNKKNIAPSLLDSYFRELKKLGYIEINKKDNIIKWVDK